MKIRVINGKNGVVYHETEDILEAANAVAWLLPTANFIFDEEVDIIVGAEE